MIAASFARACFRRPSSTLRALMLLALASSCSSRSGGNALSSNPSPASVNAQLVPLQPTVTDKKGNELPVAASRDAKGVQSDFVEGVILIRPKSDAELQSFLQRFDGTVVGNDAVPEPPAELGITLTAEERKPTQYTVLVKLDAVDLVKAATDAAALGVAGSLEFSTDSGLRTFAVVVEARTAGFSASGDFIAQGHQALPAGAIGAEFNTQESSAADAFAESRFGAAGSQSSVTAAWQFLFAHSIQRRVKLAIIDGGFWLDSGGRARGASSDFVSAPARPFQYDVSQEDAFADGPNPMSCGGSPCFWHGTGSASVALGEVDNRTGYAGTGGLVADPILLRVNGTADQRNQAVRTAVAWKADVVSMSFGGNCNVWCRMDDRDDNPFDQAVNNGSKVAFFASAGNGAGTPAMGYDVGDGNFVHPCVEDHVVCVGALNDGSNVKTQYSNFGGQVAIFAPTNIPTMPYPSSTDAMGNPLSASQAYGPEQPRPSFSGTSASTPFVAGIAAMMKAVNPNLSHDDIKTILVDTARAAVSPATRTVDALAAVRRAAEGLPIRADRFEPNSLETQATKLPAAASYSQPNLNIDARDRDYFQFQSPGTSILTLNLDYPTTLGTVSVFQLAGGDSCVQPKLISQSALTGATTGQSLMYRVPGGLLALGLSADAVNAYNLTAKFSNDLVPADDYEPNDTVATARRLPLFVGGGLSAGVATLVPKPDFVIDATVQDVIDVDYYTVRAASVPLGEQVAFAAYPTIRLYGNTASANLQVYQLNADATQGAAIGNIDVESCAKKPAEIRLEQGGHYLIRVSGRGGSYTLRNGLHADARNLPAAVRDRAYQIVHPGDPITQPLTHPEVLVFTADAAYQALHSEGTRLHLKLIDKDGTVVSEGIADANGERISLAGAVAKQAYGLDVVRLDSELLAPQLMLTWEARPPLSATANLILNPGAEITGGDVNGDFASWVIPSGGLSPRLFFYDAQEGNPSPTDTGPPDRGFHLFSGGANSPSALQQTIVFDAGFRSAIDAGRVKALFSAYLGGYAQEGDHATAIVTFFDAMQQKLGSIDLGTVTPGDRQGRTGLLRAEGREYLPVNSVFALVNLMFTKADGVTNDAYVDNLSLTLTEVAP